MSNPEKRDDRSMSDILASIRKIMAQEPASPPPGPTRATLNSVSGTALDLSREPELKLPPRKSEAEGASTPAAPTGEPVSLDELLAETPRVTTPSGPAPKPPAAPKLASEPEAAQSTGAPEWLFPRPTPSETANDTPVQVPSQAKDASPAAKATTEAALLGPEVNSAPSEQPKPTKEASSPAATIGPPAPKLGDLGSVVPARFDGAGSAPKLEAGPARSDIGDRPVLGPPLAGPLLGEPARTPTAAEPSPDVPGADALRRLIAGVIPPSAHPSLAPSAKAPEAGPVPATARTGDTPNADAGTKPASETKAEVPAAPAAQPAPTKKVDTPTPVPAPEPKPVAAAAPVITPAPPPKPAAPAIAARTEPAKPTAVVTTAAPSSEPPTKPAPAGKSMDETVVELLRPLLKDWIDTNMPRLIEPALRAELEALRNAAAKDKKD